MKKIAIQTLLLSIFIFSCSDSDNASKTTIEWLYSDEGKSVGAIYKTKWVNDQTLYLMDMRLPKEDRNILKLDPESPEKMNPLFDKQRLVDNLMSIINRDDTTMYLDWPISFLSLIHI